jgi:predicted DNA-binding protein with PD1-like motif
MNPGDDLIDALTRICVDNTIFFAQFSGIGYLKEPKLRSYNMSKVGFDPDNTYEGAFHVVSLHGNISLRDRQTVIRLHVVGTLHHAENPPILLSGELVGGEVVSLEFSLSAIDDLRFYRAEDDRTGLDPWLHMDLGDSNTLGVPKVEEIPVIEGAPGSGPVNTQDEEDAEDSSDEGEVVEVESGDWLDHPTLGACRVLATDSDEHVTIELASGRRVDLHLGLLGLRPAGRHDEGGQVYKVHVKRRR